MLVDNKLPFKDHFSGHASTYAAFRPKSPDSLFTYLATLIPQGRLAWDVGTGNGQVAVELARYFDKVIATDASEEQIKHAVLNPRVEYYVASAEDSKLRSPEVELVTVGQAFHWFDFERFFSEVRRVTRKDAVLAIWTYELALIEKGIDALMWDFYHNRLGKYWPAERKWVDEHYQTVPFPFREIKAPAFQMVEERDLEEWCGYLSTWSATQKAIKAQGIALYDDFVDELRQIWGDPKLRRGVTWPLYLRVGYVH